MDHGHTTRAIGIHTIIAFEYANATEREAAGPFADEERGKAASQLDDGSFWLLSDVGGGPGAWISLLTGGASIGGDLLGSLPRPFVVGVGGSQLMVDGQWWPDGSKTPLNRMVTGRMLSTISSYQPFFSYRFNGGYGIPTRYTLVVGNGGVLLVNTGSGSPGLGTIDSIPIPGQTRILTPNDYQILDVVWNGQQQIWMLGYDYDAGMFRIWGFDATNFTIVTGYELGPSFPDGSTIQWISAIDYVNGYLFVSFLDAVSGVWKIVQLLASDQSFVQVITYPDPNVSAFGYSVIGSSAPCSTSMTLGWSNYHVWYSAISSFGYMAAVRLTPSTLVHVHNDPDNLVVHDPATDEPTMLDLLLTVSYRFDLHIGGMSGAHTHTDFFNQFVWDGPYDPPGGPWPLTMDFANRAKLSLNRHFLDRGVHYYRDPDNLIVVPDLTDDTDLGALCTMANAIHNSYNAHLMQDAKLVHVISKSGDYESSFPQPWYVPGNYQDGDSRAASMLMYDLATKYMQHLVNPYVHETNDTVNVITADPPYDANWYNLATFMYDMYVAFSNHVTSTAYHTQADYDHVFQLADPDDWFGMLAAINHNLTAFDQHIASSTYHVTPHYAHGIWVDSATMAMGLAHLDELRTNLHLHAQSTTYHLLEDVSSLPTRVDDGTPHFPTLMALINDFANKLRAHMHEAGVHTNDDILNLFPWSDLTDDTNLQDMILSITSFFGTNGYHDQMGGVVYQHNYIFDPSTFPGRYNAHVSANSQFLESADTMISALPAALINAIQPNWMSSYSNSILLLGGQSSAWQPVMYNVVKEDMPSLYYPVPDYPAGYMMDELDLTMDGGPYNIRAPLSLAYDQSIMGYGGPTGSLWYSTSYYSVYSDTAYLVQLEYVLSQFMLSAPQSFPITYPRSTLNVRSVSPSVLGSNDMARFLSGDTTTTMYSLQDDALYPLTVEKNPIPLGIGIGFAPRVYPGGDPQYVDRPPASKLVGSISSGAMYLAGVGGFVPVLPQFQDRYWGAGGVVVGISQLDDIWLLRLSMEATAIGGSVSARLCYMVDGDTRIFNIPDASVSRVVGGEFAPSAALDLQAIVKGLSSARVTFFPEIAGGGTMMLDITVMRMCFTVEKT